MIDKFKSLYYIIEKTSSIRFMNNIAENPNSSKTMEDISNDCKILSKSCENAMIARLSSKKKCGAMPQNVKDYNHWKRTHEVGKNQK